MNDTQTVRQVRYGRTSQVHAATSTERTFTSGESYVIWTAICGNGYGSSVPEPEGTRVTCKACRIALAQS